MNQQQQPPGGGGQGGGFGGQGGQGGPGGGQMGPGGQGGGQGGPGGGQMGPGGQGGGQGGPGGGQMGPGGQGGPGGQRGPGGQGAEATEEPSGWLDTDQLLEWGGNLLMCLLILIIGWYVSKWAESLVLRAAERSKLDKAVASFLGSIARYMVLTATVIASLGQVGVETTSFVAVIASAGFAVGLALQGSLANFASGVLILVFRPFDLGDVVVVGGETGKVVDIGLFATTLVTPDNITIVIANASVTGGNITNFTRKGTRRGHIAVGVAYGADLKQVQEVCLEAAKKCPLVKTEPAPAIAFTEMAASSINFDLMVWSEVADFLAMQHEVRSHVYDGLNAAGIEIPFDQIVVHKAEG